MHILDAPHTQPTLSPTAQFLWGRSQQVHENPDPAALGTHQALDCVCGRKFPGAGAVALPWPTWCGAYSRTRARGPQSPQSTQLAHRQWVMGHSAACFISC